jgi:hypothetical protein
MTIYEVYDRQGKKHFSRKPTFIALHDIFIGPRSRAPKSGDRVIRRMTCRVERQSILARDHYPEVIKVGKPK